MEPTDCKSFCKNNEPAAWDIKWRFFQDLHLLFFPRLTPKGLCYVREGFNIKYYMFTFCEEFLVRVSDVENQINVTVGSLTSKVLNVLKNHTEKMKIQNLGRSDIR